MKLASFVLLTLITAALVAAPVTVHAIGNDNPTGVTGDHNGEITTAGNYDAYTGNAKRMIQDLSVAGAIGSYPLVWERVLNTRGLGHASDTMGRGGWTHSYDWSGWLKFPIPPGPVLWRLYRE